MFVGDAGSAHGRFARAIARRNLLGAEAAARELGQLNLEAALALCVLIGDGSPARYERAAIRWHARFVVETKVDAIVESQVVLAALAGLRQPASSALAAEVLVDASRRRGVTDVEKTLRRLGGKA